MDIVAWSLGSGTPASHTKQVPQAAWIPGRWREMYVGFHDRLARIAARPGSSVPAPGTRTDSAITHAFENAPVAPGPEKVPLLLFAAGWGVLPLGYSNVIEDLVSHGYVVGGVVFTYYAPFSLFSDGDDLRLQVVPAVVHKVDDPGTTGTSSFVFDIAVICSTDCALSPVAASVALSNGRSTVERQEWTPELLATSRG